MAAPKGNDFGLALKDPEIRQKAFTQFCEHLAKGKSIKSWYFEDGEHMCCWETMVSYIEKNPKEFSPIKKKVSEIKGYQYWESVCEDSAKGINPTANTASLQMIMRNKYGWDAKEDKKTDAEAKVVFELNYNNDNNDKIKVLPKNLSTTDTSSSK